MACNPTNGALPFRLSAFDQLGTSAKGVYAIYYRHVCIYIGKAEDQPLRSRLSQHWAGSHNPTLRAWVEAKGPGLKVATKVINDPTQIEIFERFYIRKFKPLANKKV